MENPLTGQRDKKHMKDKLKRVRFFTENKQNI